MAPLDPLACLFTIGVLAHNAEEALTLPAWSSQVGRWARPVTAREFAFAVVALSLALVFLTVKALSAGAGSLWAYLFAGYVFAMVVNVVVPHLLLTCILKRYAPGTATALLFNLPLGSAFLFLAVAQGFVEMRALWWVAPLTTLVIVGAIPLLFSIGRWLFSNMD